MARYGPRGWSTTAEAAYTGEFENFTPRSFNYNCAPPGTPSGSQRPIQDRRKARARQRLDDALLHSSQSARAPSTARSKLFDPSASSNAFQDQMGHLPVPPPKPTDPRRMQRGPRGCMTARPSLPNSNPTMMRDLSRGDMDQLANRLQQMNTTNGENIMRALHKCDHHHNGTVSKCQFDWVLLNYFKTRVSETQLDRLVQLFGTGPSEDRVSYNEFLRFHVPGSLGRQHKMRTQLY